MRQVARLFRQRAMAFGTNKDAVDGYKNAAGYADTMAVMIENGAVDERDWEFLCLIQDKLVLE